MKYADFIHVFIFEKATKKNITIPKMIFDNCDNANGCHEPPPALNKTTIENIKTTHIGINNAHEKRESFSLNVIIFALDTRVVAILF
jgi:hypothetical protein